MPKSRKPPGSLFIPERKYAPVSYPEIRAAVLRALETAPMKSEEIVVAVLAEGVGNESAIKRTIKFLREDKKIVRTKTTTPWRIA